MEPSTALYAADAKVDDIENVECEVAKIVVHGIDDFLACECGYPGRVLAAAGADLGDDDETVRIRMERLRG